MARMTKAFNAIKSTVKGAAYNDVSAAQRVVQGAQAGLSRRGLSGIASGAWGGAKGAWAGASKGDKMRWGAYGAAGIGATAWGLSGD